LDLKVPPSWGRDLGRGKKMEDKTGLRAKTKFFKMKRILLFIILIPGGINLFSQAPEAFNYSAIVRDNSGNPIVDQDISFRFSLIQGSETGSTVYSEIHNAKTDEFGQVSLIIGDGSIISGVFSMIDWGGDNFFLKVELDKTGGTSFEEMGISHLLSVPYALYAKSAGSGGGAGSIKISAGTNITITGTGTAVDPYVINERLHYVGESYGGGIVFYVYDNGRHGLIAATTDQDAGVEWYNGTNRYTNTTGNGIGAGEMNTALIIALQTNDNPLGNFAAKVCADYSVTINGENYGDWYLPSRLELTYLFINKDVVGNFTNNFYWSSTEFSSISAWGQNMANGSFYNLKKSTPYAVRAIRAF